MSACAAHDGGMPLLGTEASTQNCHCPPGREFLATATRGSLAAAIGAVSETERLVLGLFYVEGLNLAEVALVLDMLPADVLHAHAGAFTQLRTLVENASA